MTRFAIRSALFFVIALLFWERVATAQMLISEGVTYDPSTRIYEYKYALDNRSGTVFVSEVNILVGREFNSLRAFPPIVATKSPPGWQFSMTLTGGPAPIHGTLASWFGFANVGTYTSGFSLFTAAVPSGETVPNYWLYSHQTSDVVTTGNVAAPRLLPPEAIPSLSEWASVVLTAALATLGALVVGRAEM